jgi:hypothetical protein
LIRIFVCVYIFIVVHARICTLGVLSRGIPRVVIVLDLERLVRKVRVSIMIRVERMTCTTIIVRKCIRLGIMSGTRSVSIPHQAIRGILTLPDVWNGLRTHGNVVDGVGDASFSAHGQVAQLLVAVTDHFIFRRVVSFAGFSQEREGRVVGR